MNNNIFITLSFFIFIALTVLLYGSKDIKVVNDMNDQNMIIENAYNLKIENSKFNKINNNEIIGNTNDDDIKKIIWIWNGIKNSKTHTYEIISDKGLFTIIFDQNNVLSITSDCNKINANYTLNKNIINIRNVSSTMMFCENSIEEEFINTLKDSLIKINDDNTVLEFIYDIKNNKSSVYENGGYITKSVEDYNNKFK